MVLALDSQAFKLLRGGIPHSAMTIAGS